MSDLLYRQNVNDFHAQLGDFDAETLATAILADHRFAALRGGS